MQIYGTMSQTNNSEYEVVGDSLSKRPGGLLDSFQRSMGIYAICPPPTRTTERQSFVTSLKGVPSVLTGRHRHFQHALTTFCSYHVATETHLCGLGRQDVGVTGVDDGHGGATEELTASGTELDLYYGKCQVSQFVGPSKDSRGRELLLRAPEYQCPPEPCVKAPSQDMRFFSLVLSQSGVERTLLPVKWWTAVLPSME